MYLIEYYKHIFTIGINFVEVETSCIKAISMVTRNLHANKISLFIWSYQVSLVELAGELVG